MVDCGLWMERFDKLSVRGTRDKEEGERIKVQVTWSFPRKRESVRPEAGAI